MVPIDETVTSDGSSAMPHKINLCGIEKALTYLMKCQSMCTLIKNIMCNKSQKFQRIIADSSASRMTGELFADLYISLYSMTNDIITLIPNKQRTQEDLQKNPIIISEGYQTLLKLMNIPNAYQKMKNVTRITNQRTITLEKLHAYLNSLNLSENDLKEKIFSLKPETYIGIKYGF